MASLSLLEKFQVAPPPAAAADGLVPLTYLDVVWLPFHPIRRLFFYELPWCSKDSLMATVVPRLRNSLAQTLAHYSPLAGRLVYPSDPETKPVVRYSPGDSVTFSVFESNKNFDALVGNSSRDSDQFYDFIPQLPPATEESDSKVLHLLAVQVTLFPERGICMGVANHHSVGDASAIVGFLKSWASISKLGGDEEHWVSESRPIFDRSLIKDPRDLASMILKQVRNFPTGFGEVDLPTGRVRATYVFSQSEIRRLKNSVTARNPGVVHLSSFVVTAAYIWTCFAKSQIHDPSDFADDDREYFLFAVDCRSRIDPPLPENYFGNCVSYGLAVAPHVELVGERGFFVAAEAVGDEIKNKVNNKARVLEEPENWMQKIAESAQNRFLSVAGSARVDLYGLDFGWGGARKFESPSIDQDKYAFSLCRDSSGGGLEVGVSLPVPKMVAFCCHLRRAERMCV